MSEITNIVDQLERAFEGNAWHGPALTELLAGVSAQQAAARPLSGAHTIWELVRHIIHWEKVVCERLKGVRVDTPEQGDWTQVDDVSPEAWQKTLSSLREAHQTLSGLTAALPEASLERMAAGMDYTVYFMLHGVIQHNLYHGGQIALLKQA